MTDTGNGNMVNINLADFLTYPKNVLTFFGAWPYPDWKFRYIYNVYGFIMVFVVTYTFMAVLFGGIYQVLDNFEETAHASYYLISHVTAIIKFTSILNGRKKFLHLLQYLKEPVFTSHLQEQKSYHTEFLQFTRTYIKCFYGSCLLCWVLYALYPIFDQTNNSGLPMKTWPMLDVEKSMFLYFIQYAYQMLGLGVTIGVTASYDITVSALMNIACVEIQILKDNLENATRRAKEAYAKDEVQDQEKEERVELLTKDEDDFVSLSIVKNTEHHKANIRYLLDVQRTFGVGLFFQFLSGGIIICVLGLELMFIPRDLKFAMTVFYSICMVSENTLYCWNGNQVIVESADIVESCYKMHWYLCSARVKKSLFIMMERSKIPLKIMAGNFFDLSLGTLTMILRTAYSYFAVLQQLYNK